MKYAASASFSDNELSSGAFRDSRIRVSGVVYVCRRPSFLLFFKMPRRSFAKRSREGCRFSHGTSWADELTIAIHLAPDQVTERAARRLYRSVVSAATWLLNATIDVTSRYTVARMAPARERLRLNATPSR